MLTDATPDSYRARGQEIYSLDPLRVKDRCPNRTIMIFELTIVTPGSFYTSRVNSTSLDRIVNIEHSSSSSFIRGSDLSSDKTQSAGTSRIAARTSLSLVPLGSAHLLKQSPSMAGTEEEEELAYPPWPNLTTRL